ncbi:hypothetical protein BKA62DRAFT_728110 [Auriculariales sp. MPI-PUGE-AT-0066]|nr:hypothetical protein BKA62DRAFT_728110 [Auriculariales sp. MPI-PUGE-AT-0066]
MRQDMSAVQQQYDNSLRELEDTQKKLNEEKQERLQVDEALSRTEAELVVASEALARTEAELVAARKDMVALQQQKVEAQMKPKQAEAEISALQRQREKDRQELESLQRKLDEEQRSKQGMNDALARAETQLMTARNDAAALRLFSEEEDVDGETIRTLFSDLVTGIDDLVFSIFEKLSESEVNSSITVDRKRFSATDTAIKDKLWPFIASVIGTNPLVETVAMPVMQCIASSIIFVQFLQPFYPVAPDFDRDGFYDGLIRLWSIIAERESQEVIGRWRSIAYRAVRQPQLEENTFVENMANYLLASLRDVVIILLPEQLAASRDWEKLINSLMPRAVKVLRKAIAFQTMTQATCVSWDYIVYHPPSDGSFFGEIMEVDREVLDDHATVLERQPVMKSQESSVIQKARVVALRDSRSSP